MSWVVMLPVVVFLKTFLEGTFNFMYFQLHYQHYLHHGKLLFSLFKDFIYLFMRDTEKEREREREREAEIQAEGEAGSTQGAPCGTQSQVSRIITSWAEGGAKPLSHPGCP